MGRLFACNRTVELRTNRLQEKEKRCGEKEPKKKQRESAWKGMLEQCQCDSGSAEVEARKQQMAAASKALHYHTGKQVTKPGHPFIC